MARKLDSGTTFFIQDLQLQFDSERFKDQRCSREPRCSDVMAKVFFLSDCLWRQVKMGCDVALTPGAGQHSATDAYSPTDQSVVDHTVHHGSNQHQGWCMQTVGWLTPESWATTRTRIKCPRCASSIYSGQRGRKARSGPVLLLLFPPVCLSPLTAAVQPPSSSQGCISHSTKCSPHHYALQYCGVYSSAGYLMWNNKFILI